jgi:hypothetical protein
MIILVLERGMPVQPRLITGQSAQSSAPKFGVMLVLRPPIASAAPDISDWRLASQKPQEFSWV